MSFYHLQTIGMTVSQVIDEGPDRDEWSEPHILTEENWVRCQHHLRGLAHDEELERALESLKNEAPKLIEWGPTEDKSDPHRRKKRVSENAEPLTEKREHNLRRRVFFAEMIKGNATARWALLIRIMIGTSLAKNSGLII